MKFKDFSFDGKIIHALDKLHYIDMFPIQEKSDSTFYMIDKM